jgi:hypothetical protein
VSKGVAEYNRKGAGQGWGGGLNQRITGKGPEGNGYLPYGAGESSIQEGCQLEKWSSFKKKEGHTLSSIPLFYLRVTGLKEDENIIFYKSSSFFFFLISLKRILP